MGQASGLLPTDKLGRFSLQGTPPHIRSPAMQARAHLKLIVSEGPAPAPEEVVQDRVSMVQPLSSTRLRAQWLRAHLTVLALWSAAVVLLSAAAIVALGW